MALGALQAAKEAGKSSLKIYGVDGSPEMKSELTDEKSMIRRDRSAVSDQCWKAGGKDWRGYFE